MLTLPTNARWSQNEVTVAGGNGYGNALNQLYYPCGIDIDDDNKALSLLTGEMIALSNGRWVQAMEK